ncbi:hypothetical protein BJ878DRAFT_422735 [Calycina marina]|uniref:Amine oxidase domain-containing protein n=1 Tax=Calycina marina TaxID=1763456 RepID=A0A9P7Z2Q8_9HELO|nr:hypothetical protein BJ878DRAFT_422735 [Calycina marina]
MPRICIVGAGVAGLRCADTLLRDGFQVTILEARNRLGGRATHRTLPSGHVIDLGPNWIHGTEHNEMYDLANSIGTILHQFPSHSTIFDSDGQVLRDGEELDTLMWNIVGDAFKYSAEHTPIISSTTSLYDFFETTIEKYVRPGVNRKRRVEILIQLSERWGAYVGSHIKTQSLKFLWLEDCLNGENLFCASGYKNVIDHIAVRAQQERIVKLSTKVTLIRSNEKTVKVTTDAGDEDEYDEVVVTVPLGWLQRNKEIFKPILPPQMSSAIDSIGYGALEKVFISFPTPFWRIEQRDSVCNKPYSASLQWLKPTYAPDTNSQQFYQECVDLSGLPDPHGHPTLLFYIYGDQAIAISNTLKQLPQSEEKDKYITEAFKPYFCLLPGYNAALKDCVPNSCYMTEWFQDEFAGFGSYSTFRTGLEAADRDIKIMREGLPNRSIWFAGEHVAPFTSMGTIDGAYMSGESVAKRISAAYGVTPLTTSESLK